MALTCLVMLLSIYLSVGGIFAGVISDYLGGRALTCLVMLLFAAPSVSKA